ncbi:MAG: hypothetical protein R2909_08120 [Gemmatimonadales bacterium]
MEALRLALALLATVTPTGAADPIAGILGGFEQARVVALGETHGHDEFHQLVIRLLEDPRAQALIDDVAVEWGNALYQGVIDRYLDGGAVPWDSVTMAWRNTVVSPGLVWDAPVYQRFFEAIRRINTGLPTERRYRVILADSPVDWSRVTSRDDLQPFGDRALAMADNVRRLSLLRGRRALFLAGGLHVHRQPRTFPTRDGIPRGEIPSVAWIELKHPGTVYVIQSMARAVDLEVEALIGSGPPRLVTMAESPALAALDADRVHTLRNADGTKPRVYRDLRLGDLVDAVILWDRSALHYPEPDPATYRVDWYWQELERRSRLLRGRPMDPALREPSDGGP